MGLNSIPKGSEFEQAGEASIPLVFRFCWEGDGPIKTFSESAEADSRQNSLIFLTREIVTTGKRRGPFDFEVGFLSDIKCFSLATKKGCKL